MGGGDERGGVGVTQTGLRKRSPYANRAGPGLRERGLLDPDATAAAGGGGEGERAKDGGVG